MCHDQTLLVRAIKYELYESRMETQPNGEILIVYEFFHLVQTMYHV
jgi:hypothetical protein